MATVRKRGEKFVVIYDYKDASGKRKQKWEAFTSEQEAKKYKAKIEYEKSIETFITPSAKTVADFLLEFADTYSRSRWSYSMYTRSLLLIRKHINPLIGERTLQSMTPLDIERLYNTLRTTKCSGSKSYGREEAQIPYLSTTTVRHIHTLLKTAFTKAVEWGYIQKSPVTCASPKKAKPQHTIWNKEQIQAALQAMEPLRLKVLFHLVFICSLRIGEALGIRWEDVDFVTNSIRISKTLQRVRTEALHILPPDTLVHTFNPKLDGASCLVLKYPKTASSERMVYFTTQLRCDLLDLKAQIAKESAFLGDAYTDFDLAFCLEDGSPVEPKLAEKWFQKWQKNHNDDLDLPMLTFHEVRHSSATFKLIASQGDVKTVQGDLGHQSADMSVNTYSQIQDSRRQQFVHKLESDFYTQKDAEENVTPTVESLLSQVSESPDLQRKLLAALLAQHSKS